MNERNIFTPGPTPNTVRSADGKILTAPDDWILLPPGDAALTRRVKAAGDHWVVAEKKAEKRGQYGERGQCGVIPYSSECAIMKRTRVGLQEQDGMTPLLALLPPTTSGVLRITGGKSVWLSSSIRGPRQEFSASHLVIIFSIFSAILATRLGNGDFRIAVS